MRHTTKNNPRTSFVPSLNSKQIRLERKKGEIRLINFFQIKKQFWTFNCVWMQFDFRTLNELILEEESISNENGKLRFANLLVGDFYRRSPVGPTSKEISSQLWTSFLRVRICELIWTAESELHNVASTLSVAYKWAPYCEVKIEF